MRIGLKQKLEEQDKSTLPDLRTKQGSQNYWIQKKNGRVKEGKMILYETTEVPLFVYWFTSEVGSLSEVALRVRAGKEIRVSAII